MHGRQHVQEFMGTDVNAESEGNVLVGGKDSGGPQLTGSSRYGRHPNRLSDKGDFERGNNFFHIP